MDGADATAIAVDENKEIKDEDSFRDVLTLNLVSFAAPDFAIRRKIKGDRLIVLNRIGSISAVAGGCKSEIKKFERKRRRLVLSSSQGNVISSKTLR